MNIPKVYKPPRSAAWPTQHTDATSRLLQIRKHRRNVEDEIEKIEKSEKELHARKKQCKKNLTVISRAERAQDKVIVRVEKYTPPKYRASLDTLSDDVLLIIMGMSGSTFWTVCKRIYSLYKSHKQLVTESWSIHYFMPMSKETKPHDDTRIVEYNAFVANRRLMNLNSGLFYTVGKNKFLSERGIVSTEEATGMVPKYYLIRTDLRYFISYDAYANPDTTTIMNRSTGKTINFLRSDVVPNHTDSLYICWIYDDTHILMTDAHSTIVLYNMETNRRVYSQHYLSPLYCDEDIMGCGPYYATEINKERGAHDGYMHDIEIRNGMDGHLVTTIKNIKHYIQSTISNKTSIYILTYTQLFHVLVHKNKCYKTTHDFGCNINTLYLDGTVLYVSHNSGTKLTRIL
jgi:hypothetical protein